MRNIISFTEKADFKICYYVSLYITSLLANLAVGYRYISIGNFNQSGGILIFPFSFIISDIIAEKYGSTLAKKLVYYGIFCQLVFSLYAAFIIRMPAPSFLLNKETYFLVFDPYLMFSLASSISILIGSWVNIVFLSKLSEYYGGRLFAVRSFFASAAGEFLVTVISMLIANYGRMEFHQLIYMILCCFILKTIISFFAIWPAAIVLYSMDNNGDYDISFKFKNIKNPFLYIKNLAYAAWNAKGYVYNLESINIITKKADLYYKGSRKSVSISLCKLYFNKEIISRCKSDDASHIGYYAANTNSVDNLSLSKSTEYFLSKNESSLTIKSIIRNKNIEVLDQKNNVIFFKSACDLYLNKKLMDRFSSIEASYIGYLAGTLDKLERLSIKNRTNRSNLVLIK